MSKYTAFTPIALLNQYIARGWGDTPPHEIPQFWAHVIGPDTIPGEHRPSRRKRVPRRARAPRDAWKERRELYLREKGAVA